MRRLTAISLLAAGLLLSGCSGEETATTTAAEQAPPPSERAGGAPQSQSTTVVWSDEQVQAFIREHPGEVRVIDHDFLSWREWTGQRRASGDWLCTKHGP